jgi:hypothetical protein
LKSTMFTKVKKYMFTIILKKYDDKIEKNVYKIFKNKCFVVYFFLPSFSYYIKLVVCKKLREKMTVSKESK